jgi:hypothetical protein
VLGDGPKEVFLDLFNIACVKDALVAIHLELSSGSPLSGTLCLVG